MGVLEILALGNLMSLIKSFAVLNFFEMMSSDILIKTLLKLSHDFRKLVSLPFNDLTIRNFLQNFGRLIFNFDSVGFFQTGVSLKVVLLEFRLLYNESLNVIKKTVLTDDAFGNLDVFEQVKWQRCICVLINLVLGLVCCCLSFDVNVFL